MFLMAGCATPSKNLVGGVYVSPNGGFSYEIPEMDRIELKVHEDILPNGGNVRFLQWSHFKRVDYVSLYPTVEREIQDAAFREGFLRLFTTNVFLPGVVEYVPEAEVRETSIEEIGGTRLLYVSMFMPAASATSVDGKRLDGCRCSLTHSDGKRVYVFTVSAAVDRDVELTPEEAFAKTEKWVKRELFSFFGDVRIQ